VDGRGSGKPQCKESVELHLSKGGHRKICRRYQNTDTWATVLKSLGLAG
jgi:hypothetical protein